MLLAILLPVFNCHAQGEPVVYKISADGTPLIIEGRLEDGDSKVDDGTVYDTYIIQAQPGTLMAQLNSAAFDPFLKLYGVNDQGELIPLGVNDDGPEEESFGLNAFLENDLSRERELVVVITSVDIGIGPYRLAMAIGPAGKRGDLIRAASKQLDAGMAAYQANDLKNTERLFKLSLKLYILLYPGDHPDIAFSLNELANVRRILGSDEEAQPLYEEALAMRRRLYQINGKGDHPDIAFSLNELANVRRNLGQDEEAKPLYEEALAMRRRLYQINGIVDHPDIAFSLNELANVWWNLGRVEEAQPLYEEALAMRRRLYQINGIVDHPDIAFSLNELANVWRNLGQDEEAQPLYEEALAMRRHLFQNEGIVDHRDIVTSLDQLAIVWWNLGRAEEAEPLYQEALAMRQRLFQAEGIVDHPDITKSLNNLAAILKKLGRIEEADPLFEEALAMRRRLFQAEGIIDHRDIAFSLNELADVWWNLGRVEEAQPLFEEALAMNRRLFQAEGIVDHRDFATSMNNLASVRQNLGRAEEAVPLYQEALAMRQRLFQAEGIVDHPDITKSLNNLAAILKKLGRIEEAEPLFEEALAMRRRLYQINGIVDHPDIAFSLNELANVWWNLGRVEEAQPLFEEALAMNRRLFQAEGIVDHRDIATSLNKLAIVLEKIGRTKEAEPLYEKALAMNRRLYRINGIVDHTEIAASLKNLAYVRFDIGRAKEAESLYEEALAMNRRLFQLDGIVEHTEIATSLINLAYVRLDLGRAKEADPLYEEALAIYQRLYQIDGEGDHPDIAMSLNNLAYIRQELGQDAMAEPLYEKSLAMSRRLFQIEGIVDHPEIAANLNNIASVRVALGRAAEAESYYEEALAMHRRLFQFDSTRNHPKIATSLNNLGALRLELGQTAEAEPLFEEALAMRRRLFQIDGIGDHPDIALSLNDLATVRQELGGAEEVQPLFEEALAMRRRLFQIDGIGDHPDIALSLNNLAALRLELGQAAEAEPLFEEAMIMYRRLYQIGGKGNRLELLESILNFAWIKSLSEPARAEQLYTEALSIAERLRLHTRGDVESRALMAGKINLPTAAFLLADLRLTMGDYNAAFAAFETGRSRSLMDLFELDRQGGLDSVIAKLPDGQRRSIEQAQAAEDTSRAETAQAEAVLAASANRIDLSDADREQLRLDAIHARTALGDAISATNSALGNAVPSSHAMSSTELQTALLPGEVVLSIGWRGNDILLFTVTEDHIVGEVLWVDAADRSQKITRLGDQFEELAMSLRSSAYLDPDLLRHCAETLIPNSLQDVILDADRVIVINSGPASRIPADLLVAQINPAAEVVQSHSASQFVDRRRVASERHLARENAGTLNQESAIILARPQYAGSAPELPTYEVALADSHRSASRSLNAYRLMEDQLTDLPGTQTEAMIIATSLDAAGINEGNRRKTLLGPDASIQNLRAEVERLSPRILHIATHGMVGTTQDPLDAALALTPGPDDYGFLTLDDIIRQWPGLLHDTDLVVLSACDTGWGAKAGETEFGLPWGFFLSGATSVVASLWQVDDISTALLMARFHEGRLGSFAEPRTIRGRTFQPETRMTTLDALDEAKQWIRTLTREEIQDALSSHLARLSDQDRGSVNARWEPPTESDKPYEHPYYWAAFVLFGSPE